MEYLYRGVHAEHPALQEARNGIIRPADADSDISAEEHNLGWVSGDSAFTSWTHDRKWAEWCRDRRGPSGVLLRVPLGSPAFGEEWSWVHSKDAYYEDEILMRGVRLNIEVIE